MEIIQLIKEDLTAKRFYSFHPIFEEIDIYEKEIVIRTSDQFRGETDYTTQSIPVEWFYATPAEIKEFIKEETDRQTKWFNESQKAEEERVRKLQFEEYTRLKAVFEKSI